MTTQVFSVTAAAQLPCTASRQIWKADATGGALTLTLPDATLCAGVQITATKTDAGVNAVTLARATTQTILGTGGAAQTSLAMATQGKSFTVVSDGANWLVISAV